MSDVSMLAEVIDHAETVLSFGRLDPGPLSYNPKMQQRSISLGEVQQREIRLAAAEEIDALVSLRIRFKNVVVFAFEFV